MEAMKCPYCGQEKEGGEARDFTRCRFCGFRSALVDSDKNGRLLIVDRRMPFLQRHCDDLSSQMTDVTVIVDRRVAQDVRDQPERRFNYFEEDEGLMHAPRTLGEQVGAEDINPV